jgi:NhaP-type Na+/H+ or K+/H+ antiporter
MVRMLLAQIHHLVPRLRRQEGAVGWLVIGVIIGAILVVGLIVKLLIPGD